MIRRILSFFMIISFGLQSISPVFAIPDSLESLERNENTRFLLEHASSLPSASVFLGDSDRTAAGTFIYAEHEGTVKVLLARRDEGNGWCNFGGKSDAEDGFLDRTGARETGEESLGIYDVEPRILKGFYSHDLYNPKGPIALYRMYFAPGQYVPAETFMEKLNTATEAHHQEYTHFAWVPLKDLRKVVAGRKQFGEVLQDVYKAGAPAQPETPEEESGEASGSQTSVSTQQPPLDFDSEILFEPLQWMLESKPVQDRIALLLGEGPRPDPIALRNTFPWLAQTPASQFMAPQPHTISQVGAEAEYESISVRWESVRPKQAEESANFMTPGQRTRIIMGKSTDSRKVRELYRETVQFDPAREKERVVEALVNRVLVNGEIKKRSAEIKRLRGIEENRPVVGSQAAASGSGSSSERKYTASEAHLKIALGEEYVEGHTHEDYKENFRRLVAKYGMKEELRREVDLTDEALDRLAEIFETERHVCFDPKLDGMPFHYTAFNHGLAEDMMMLYRSFSAWDSVLSMKPYQEFSTLRGTHAYMNLYQEFNNALEKFYEEHRKLYMELYEKSHDPTQIERDPLYQECMRAAYDKLHEIMERTLPTRDHLPNNGALWLWVNAAIAAGKGTTNTTSSSVEYFLNSHSVNAPNDAKRFQEATALKGMKASYGPYQSLFNQFVKVLAPQGGGNGGFLQVFVRSDQQDVFSYTTAHGGGEPYGHPMNVPEAERNPWVSKLLNLLHQAAIDPDSIENLKFDLFRKSLISEVCVLQHPLLMQNERPRAWDAATTNPNEVDALAYEARYNNPEFPRAFVKGYDRHPMTADQHALFDLQLQRTAAAQAVGWLLQDTFALEGSSYQGEPSIKKLYRMVHQDLTGAAPVEKPYTQALPYLMELGNVEAVKGFLAIHPNALEEARIDFKDQFVLLCSKGKWEMAIYLHQLMNGEQKLTEILSEQDIKNLLRFIATTDYFSKDSVDFFRGQIDISRFDQPIQDYWLKWALDGDGDSAVDALRFFLESGCKISSKYRKSLVQTYYNNLHSLKRLIEAGYPVDQENDQGQTLLEEFLDAKPTVLNGGVQYAWEQAVSYLIQKGANWRRDPNNPIFFQFGKSLSCNDEFPKIFERILPDLQTHRNGEGLTFLQYRQKAFLEGDGNYITPGCEKSLIPLGMSYKDASYAEFLEYAPNPSSTYNVFYGSNPWKSVEAREWQRGLNEILEQEDFEALKQHIATYPDLRVLEVNRNRISLKTPLGVFRAINDAAFKTGLRYASSFALEIKKALALTEPEEVEAAIQIQIERLRSSISHFTGCQALENLKDLLEALKNQYPHLYQKFEQKEQQLYLSTSIDLMKELVDPIKHDLEVAIDEGDLRGVKAALDRYKTLTEEHPEVPSMNLGGQHERKLGDFCNTLHAFTVASSYINKTEVWKKDLDTHLKADQKDLKALADLIDQYPMEDEGLSFCIIDSAGGIPLYYSLLLSDEAVEGDSPIMTSLINKINPEHWPQILNEAIERQQYKFIQAFFSHYPDLVKILSNPSFRSVLHFFADEEAMPTLEAILSRIPNFFTEGDVLLGEETYRLILMVSLLNEQIRDQIPFEKFKIMNSGMGGPYFWTMLLLPKNKEWAMQVVSKDPSFLELRSVEGLDIESFVSLVKHSEKHHTQINHIESTLKALRDIKES